MPSLEEQIISALNNSKEVPELPLETAIADSDYIIFYKASTGKLSRITRPNSKEQLNVQDVYLGTVTTAGSTTTESEIATFINSQGFTINKSELKIIKVNVYINNVLYTKLYYLRGNAAGTYGNAGDSITFANLFEFESVIVSANSPTTSVVALGDIGSSTISDYINGTNDPSYELESDIIYVFTATIDSVEYSFLYVGLQPQELGDGNNAVSEDDFIQLSPEDSNDVPSVKIIDGYMVNTTGNTNPNAIEVGNVIQGNRGGSSRYIIARVDSSDYTDDANLTFYLDSSVI